MSLSSYPSGRGGLLWKCIECGKVYWRDYFGGFIGYVSLEESTAYVLQGFQFGEGTCRACYQECRRKEGCVHA